MDLPLTIGLLGLIISAWGIYLVLKYRYFLGQISFVKEHTIALFDTIVKNLPDLAVLYKDKPVTPNLVLIRGALLNSGKKDISPAMVEKPITIKLPNGYRWIESKLISASENLKAAINMVDTQSLILETGLFKPNEYVRFEALLEAPIENGNINRSSKELIQGKVDKAIEFSHRIADLRKINKMKVEEGDRKFKLKTDDIIIILFIIGFGLIYPIANFIYPPPGEIIYSYKKAQNEIIDVRIIPEPKNMIKIEEINKKYNVTLSADDFISNVNKIYVKPKSDQIKALSIIVGISFAMALIFVIISYLSYRKNKKLRIIFSID
jgi:hypothetical protein